MTRNPNSVSFSRRRLLQTLGTVGAAGLAGCGGEGGSGEGSTSTDGSDFTETESTDTSSQTETSVEDVEHVDLSYWPQEFLLTGEGYEGMMFDSWSPQQIRAESGESPLEVSYLENPYQDLNFAPEEVPETFLQVWNEGDYWASAKVDQLPGGISSDGVKQSLESNGYEKVNEIGEFGVYSIDGTKKVHAVSPEHHVIAANITKTKSFDASQSQLRDYLEDVLRDNVNGESGEPSEIAQLREALGPKDTFGAVNQPGVNNFAVNSGVFVYHSELGKGYQPTHGAASVDVEEGTKYGAWLFEEEDIAEEVKTTLRNDNKKVYNDWEDISRDGRIMRATGQIDLDSHIENSKHIKNGGLLVRPKI